MLVFFHKEDTTRNEVLLEDLVDAGSRGPPLIRSSSLLMSRRIRVIRLVEVDQGKRLHLMGFVVVQLLDSEVRNPVVEVLEDHTEQLDETSCVLTHIKRASW